MSETTRGFRFTIPVEIDIQENTVRDAHRAYDLAMAWLEGRLELSTDSLSIRAVRMQAEQDFLPLTIIQIPLED